jgi:hypothetical protein
LAAFIDSSWFLSSETSFNPAPEFYSSIKPETPAIPAMPLFAVENSSLNI